MLLLSLLEPAQALKALEALRPLLPADSLIEIEKHQQQQQLIQQQKQYPNQHNHYQQQQHHKNGRRIIQRHNHNNNIIHYDNDYGNNDIGYIHNNDDDYSTNSTNRHQSKISKLQSNRLPSIRHNSTDNTNPPLSVRSTKSEPIKITKLKDFSTISTKPKVSKSAGQVLPALTHKNLNDSNRYYSSSNSHNQPPYNTGAMLKLLRLERDTRALDIATPKQPDFKGFWGWNQKGKNCDNNNGSIPGNNSIQVTEWGDGGTDFEDSIDSHLGYKSKKEMVIAEKINRVKKMQQVYSEKQKSLDMAQINRSPNHEENNFALMKSPIRVSSPNINDMELTDTELIQVSKYFKESGAKSSKNLVHIPTPLKLDNNNSPHKDTPSPEVKGSDLGNLSRMNSKSIIEHSDHISNHMSNSNSNNNRYLGDFGDITDSPLASTSDLHAVGTLDELYTDNTGNAADNILRWSLSLDTDNL